MVTEAQPETDIVLYPSRWKMLLLAFGSLLFSLVSALCIPLVWPRGSIFTEACTIAATLGCAFCFLYALGRLLWPRPSLIINDLGITDNASAVGAGFVAWEEINSVALSSFNESRFLVIVPHNARAILARQPLFKRLVMAANIPLVGSPITIPGTLLLPLKEVATLLQIRLEERAFHSDG